MGFIPEGKGTRYKMGMNELYSFPGCRIKVVTRPDAVSLYIIAERRRRASCPYPGAGAGGRYGTASLPSIRAEDRSHLIVACGFGVSLAPGEQRVSAELGRLCREGIPYARASYSIRLLGNSSDATGWLRWRRRRKQTYGPSTSPMPSGIPPIRRLAAVCRRAGKRVDSDGGSARRGGAHCSLSIGS
jgi:hypothetical protein